MLSTARVKRHLFAARGKLPGHCLADSCSAPAPPHSSSEWGTKSRLVHQLLPAVDALRYYVEGVLHELQHLVEEVLKFSSRNYSTPAQSG